MALSAFCPLGSPPAIALDFSRRSYYISGMKKIFKAQTLRRQIIALISGQLMLLGLITALVSYQVRLVESKITEVADLKDPSPFTASLCVSLNKITLNLLAYTHNQDKQSLQGVSQGETDFENSLVEFQKMNPRLFPVAAQTKILSAYQPFKESSSDILHAYADQLQKWTDLLDNNDQIVELFERRLRPLIRPGQKQAGQRLDLVSNLEGEVRAIPKDLTAYVIRRGGQEKQVDWNDHKFETLLRIYQHIATIRAERKVLDVIDGLWSDNVALAQRVAMLEYHLRSIENHEDR